MLYHNTDRTVRIWEAIARRYKDNPWVAGYNLLNEPTDKAPGATRLLSFYKRLGDAVRAVDPDHIICFDGNTFGADFRDFDAAGFTFENAIYSCHDCKPFLFLPLLFSQAAPALTLLCRLDVRLPHGQDFHRLG